MKKKLVIVGVLLILIGIGLYIYNLTQNKIKNNSYVIVTTNSSIYNKNQKEVGKIYKGTIVKISNRKNSYYRLYNSKFYIKSNDIKQKKYKIKKTKKYIVPLNKKIKINKKVTLLNDNKKAITISNINTKINRMNNNYYFIDIFGNNFSLNKNKVKQDIKNENNNIPVINYNEISNKDCISCVNEQMYLEHIKYLEDNNYYTININDYYDYIRGYINIKDKAILLTTSKRDAVVDRLNKNNKIKLQVSNKKINFINSNRKPNNDINNLNRYNIKKTTSIETFKKMVNKEDVLDPYPFKRDANEQEIPVLNYHFFYDSTKGEGCGEDICLDTVKFRKQLDYLKENNYKTLTMEEFTEWMYGDIELPEKSVLITIDDGAMGTGKHNGNKLIPLLEEYNMKATLFLISGWWNVENYRSKNLDIQSHTFDMHNRGECGKGQVVCATEEKLLDDLNKSLQIVDNNNSFCFPFYQYSKESLNTVEKAGFKLSFIGGNTKAKRSDNKYMIPRYPVHESHTFEDFVNMLK